MTKLKNTITINLLPGTLSWLYEQDSPSGIVQVALIRYRQRRGAITEAVQKINQMIIDATFSMTAAQERTFWEELENSTTRGCD